jgi:hypothetical protein
MMVATTCLEFSATGFVMGVLSSSVIDISAAAELLLFTRALLEAAS